MANLIDRGCFFQLRIFEEETVDESGMNIDVDVFVDRAGD